MSQYKHNYSKFTGSKTVLSGLTALWLVAGSTMLMSEPSYAAVSPAKTTILTSDFETLSGKAEQRLDYMRQSVTLTFDMPSTLWTDDVELLLSASPEGSVVKRTPLMVRFNGSKPIPVMGRGQRFEARITLEKSRMRSKNNRIEISYDTPTGEVCLKKGHGAWTLDLSDSQLVVKSREKSRTLQVGDMQALINAPLTQPGKIGISAVGEYAPAVEALIAQGMALRLSDAPEFSIGKSGDLVVLAGTRAQLKSSVTDDRVLDGTGPALAVEKGRPARIILTGDTDADVLDITTAFAAHALPKARRRAVSMAEMTMQNAFADNRASVADKTFIDDLGDVGFVGEFRPEPNTLNFQVEDAKAASGEMVLRLKKNNLVGKNSRLSVNLNGESIGYTELDKTRKTVVFDVPVGGFQPSGNTMSLTPVFEDRLDEFGCVSEYAFGGKQPALFIGERSHLKVKRTAASPVTDLSRFASTGAPFSLAKGQGTAIVIAGRTKSDRADALELLARAAKTSGYAWTDAAYDYTVSADVTDAISRGANLLVIGTGASLPKDVSKNAPEAFTQAMRGIASSGTQSAQALTGFNTFKTASASNADVITQIAALQTDSRRKIKRGGVAALFPTGYGEGVAGVFTANSKSGFAAASKALMSDANWNALSGSVTRWDNRSILMAQTAQPLTPQPLAPQPVKAQPAQVQSGAQYASPKPPKVAPVATPKSGLLSDLKMPSFKDMSLPGGDAILASAPVQTYGTATRLVENGAKSQMNRLEGLVVRLTSSSPRTQLAAAGTAVTSGATKLRGSADRFAVKSSSTGFKRTLNRWANKLSPTRAWSKLRASTNGRIGVIGLIFIGLAFLILMLLSFAKPSYRGHT